MHDSVLFAHNALTHSCSIHDNSSSTPFRKGGNAHTDPHKKHNFYAKKAECRYTDRLPSTRKTRSKKVGRSSDSRQETSAFSPPTLPSPTGGGEGGGQWLSMKDASYNRLQRRGPFQTLVKKTNHRIPYYPPDQDTTKQAPTLYRTNRHRSR